MTVILNYGLGNLGSIRNMLDRIGHKASISADPGDVADAERLILPGVGAFDEGMRRFAEAGFLEPLRRRVLEEGAPLLGICLGMQMLLDGSDEGELPGLGFIKGRCRRIRPEGGLKVPHMGWNTVRVRASASLFAGLEEQPRFYFVHSFAGDCEDPVDVAAEADYGGPLTAAVARGNVYGVQFHPEKSHSFGMRLLDNFARLSC